MSIRKRDIIFWADFFIIIAAVIGFFLCSDTVKPIYVNMLTVVVMPIITSLNVGLSAVIFKGTKNAGRK